MTRREIATFVHALDFGNFDIKAATQGIAGELVIRSIRADIYPGVSAKRHSEDSPIVVIASENAQGGRIAYHFGYQARKYSTGYIPVVLGDKLEINGFRQAMLATFRPVNGLQQYRVALKMSVPSEYRDAAAFQTLKGVYHFTRNGLEMQVEVISVDVFLEGVPAYAYAASLGMVAEKGYTLLNDIGGGTWNALLFDSQGDVVGEPASRDGGGGIALATKIASNGRLRTTLNNEPKLDLIQDGLANGSHTYGETNASWASWYQPYVDSWYREGLSYVGVKFNDYLPSITRFVFVGGNTNLLEAKIKAASEKLREAGSQIAYYMVPQPNLANVRGLLLL